LFRRDAVARLKTAFNFLACHGRRARKPTLVPVDKNLTGSLFWENRGCSVMVNANREHFQMGVCRFGAVDGNLQADIENDDARKSKVWKTTCFLRHLNNAPENTTRLKRIL